jgi:putative ABC transport system permease protein
VCDPLAVFSVRVSAVSASTERSPACLTAQRTQEFGVRLALGLAGALVVARMLSNLLYGVSPVDALTISSAIGLVALVAVGAIGWPAWRAAHVDPLTALRAE